MPNKLSMSDMRRGSDALEAARFAAGVTALTPNSYLTELSVGYQQDGFIADIVAPRIPVTAEKGEYPKWGREHFQSESKTGDVQPGIIRPLRGESLRVDISPTTGDYECEEYGVSYLLDERETNQWSDAEEAYANNVSQLVALEREVRVSAMLFSATYLTNYTTLSGTTQWSDTVNSDPLGDIDTGIENCMINGGVRPTHAVMNFEVNRKLRRHPALLEVFKVLAGGKITNEQLASVIDVPSILVASAIYDNSDEGANYSGAWVWPDYFALIHVPTTPGILTPAACYQLYTKDRTVLTDAVPRQHSQWYEISETQDEIVPTPHGAYLIVDAIA